nr:MAG TPA: hypothetical protein [Caudoviricetes sp.]
MHHARPAGIFRRSSLIQFSIQHFRPTPTLFGVQSLCRNFGTHRSPCP